MKPSLRKSNLKKGNIIVSILNFFALSFLAFAVAGCAAAPMRNMARVQPGMSRDDATKYLGKPLHTIKKRNGEDLLYDIASSPLDSDRSDTKTYVVRIKDDKVSTVGLYKGLVQIKVSTLGAIDPKKLRAYLLPGNEGVTAQDLQFREFLAPIKESLKEKGYRFVDSPKDAQTLIFLSYGISAPNVEYQTVSTPVYRWVYRAPAPATTISGSSQSTITDSYGRQVGNISTQHNYQSTSGASFGTLEREYGGQNTYTKKLLTFRRSLVLHAYLNERVSKKESVVPIWETRLESDGSSDDLREIAPLMIEAADSYIGAPTSKAVRISNVLSEDL